MSSCHRGESRVHAAPRRCTPPPCQAPPRLSGANGVTAPKTASTRRHDHHQMLSDEAYSLGVRWRDAGIEIARDAQPVFLDP
jgi:hypothetical protein